MTKAQVEKEIKQAFLVGYEQGVLAYAVWKDGIQKVGILQQDLFRVFEEIETGKDTYFESCWYCYQQAHPV